MTAAARAQPAARPRPVRSWVIAGGGSGGHVTPALALAEVIEERGDRVLMLGAEGGLETHLVPEAGFELATLPSRRVMGQRAGARLRAAAGLIPTTAAALRILRRAGADIVVSVGGYAAVPAVLAAALRRTPLAVVEPNAVPGRVNRIAARVARRIFVAYEAAARRLGRDGRAVLTGVPVRRALREAFRAGAPARQPKPPLRLLVFGGSQGARQLNDAMIAAAPQLDPAAVEIAHQSGPADRERVAAAYAAAGLRAEVFPFDPDMPSRYLRADLALCRAGAVSLAELALAGLPALLVGLPHAADDHQDANARELERAGAALRFDPRRFAASDVVAALERLAREPQLLTEMARRAAARARPDAAEQIVAECEHMLADGNEDGTETGRTAAGTATEVNVHPRPRPGFRRDGSPGS